MVAPGIGAISAAVASIAQNAASFAKAASEGSFAVSENGGRALLQAIREMRDWINAQDNRLYQLQQPPPLGTSHGAETLKPYVQNVATDQEGFITMLKAFGDSLDQAEQGIQDAMANYKTMDTQLARPYTAEA
ncbi:MAG: hypothetical protein ACRDSK_15925 [Actinophytocola sp.]|uniref:hypothetical protein n=1 Tax=Actinophytocola sp. TaxID=1872138 RepID=UPI003D6B4305